MHSFFPDISMAPLQIQRRSRLQHWYCVGVNTPKRYRQQQENDFPKVPTWRLQWDSNLRPSGRKAPNLPLSHHNMMLVYSLTRHSSLRFLGLFYSLSSNSYNSQTWQIRWISEVYVCWHTLRRETPAGTVSVLCRERLWVLVDLKWCYRNGLNEWINEMTYCKLLISTSM